MPGVTIPTDLAPTQVGVTIESPARASTTGDLPAERATPQLFAVSQPYVDTAPGTFTINGPRLRRQQGRRPGHPRTGPP